MRDDITRGRGAPDPARRRDLSQARADRRSFARRGNHRQRSWAENPVAAMPVAADGTTRESREVCGTRDAATAFSRYHGDLVGVALRFADSLLEGTGFEPSVPPRKRRP